MDLKLMLKDWGITHPWVIVTLRRNNKDNLKALEDLDQIFMSFGDSKEIYKKINENFTPIKESMLSFLFNNDNSAEKLKKIIDLYLKEHRNES